MNPTRFIIMILGYEVILSALNFIVSPKDAAKQANFYHPPKINPATLN